MLLHAPATARLRADVQQSLILRSLNDVLPPSRAAAERARPGRPGADGARPGRAGRPARPGDRLRPRRRSHAGDSVVRVLSTACGLGIEGSGWAVEPGTRRHQRARGRRRRRHHRRPPRTAPSSDATPVYYEPRNDLALLQVGAGAAAAADRRAPRGGEDARRPRLSRKRPLRAGAGAARRNPRRRSARTPTATGRSSATITALQRQRSAAATPAGRWSTRRGEVVGTVFAATTSGPRGGFAIPAEQVVEAALDEHSRRRVRSTRGPARAERRKARHLRSVSSASGAGRVTQVQAGQPKGRSARTSTRAIELIGKRWTGAIVCALTEGPLRFGELAQGGARALRPAALAAAAGAGGGGPGRARGRSGDAGAGHLLADRGGRELGPAIERAEGWAKRWKSTASPGASERRSFPGPSRSAATRASCRSEMRERARVQLIGEVTGVGRSKVQAYFELRDGEGAVPCAIWLNDLEKAGLPEGGLRDGAEVVIAGGPDYYPGGGQASPSFCFRATARAAGRRGRPDRPAGGAAQAAAGRGPVRAAEAAARGRCCRRRSASSRPRRGAARRDLLAGLAAARLGRDAWSGPSRRCRTAARRRRSRRRCRTWRRGRRSRRSSSPAAAAASPTSGPSATRPSAAPWRCCGCR